jgi:hypothetical protein
VLFLNGSKVVSSGSALTFDGSTVGVFGGTTVNYRFNANRGTDDTNNGLRFGYGGIDAYRTSELLSSPMTSIMLTQTGSDGTRTGYELNSSGQSVWSVGGTEQMRLTSTGLGIGTSSPSGQLSLGTNGSTQVGSQILLYDAGSASNANNYGLAVNASTGEFSASAGTSGYFTFYTLNRTERMRLDSSGNLGIGTSSPSTYSLAQSLVVATSGGGGMTIRTSNASYGGLYFADGVTGDEQYRGYIQYNHNFSGLTDALIFGTAGTGNMTLDSSGNLGLGVTPSASWSGQSAIQVNARSAFTGSSNFTGVATNAIATSNGWAANYLANGFAALYTQGVSNGDHAWYTAPSGTAGNAISFTQAMTLDASGNLLVGTTSPVYSTAGRGLIELNGSSTSLYALKVGDTAYGYLAASSSITELAANGASQPLVFTTNNTERARIPAAGGMVVGTAALTTTATDGFLYVPTCAGTPTGTPTTQTGTAPIVVDTTNNKLYFYSGGQWRDAGP